jgi:cephalosporin-C deacetylase-like acetyl esterase
MKKSAALIQVLLLLSGILISVCGQGIILKQSRTTGIYKNGQQIIVTAFKDGMTGDTLHVRVVKNNFTEILNNQVMMEGDSLIVFQGSFREPCSVKVEAFIKGKPVSIGMVVAPLKLKPGGDSPEDFSEYWKQERKNLMALPMEVSTATVDEEEVETGYSCVNIEINCTGPKPARGYFAKPEIASPKSLPIVILVHAAGVKGSWCRSEPGNAMKYAKLGALCFDLNAHGMLNGQPEEYYANLEEGELKNYYYQGLTSRDDFYFRGMYLRLMRTIEFLCRQPEWDRKRILVIGESQGGGQALVAAGLDKRVSAVVALVPAMCDWLGPLADREGGWPQPLKANFPKEEIIKTVPYFDAANILKGSKATIFVEIGLIDVTCPPSSVYAAINRSRGRKFILAVPYREHHQPQNNMTKTWEETVYKPRVNFITDYLK